MKKSYYSKNLDGYNYEEYHKKLGLHCHEVAEDYHQAVNWCHEDENNDLWCGNTEYSSIVNYCPFCGYKSKHIDVVETE